MRRGHDALAVRPGNDTAAAVSAALQREGSIGVIAADADVPALRDLASDRVEVIPASLAKGLEYDHVVVVEPSRIVAAEPRGLRRLYVVLTRAVTSLTVVHDEPLPPQLAA